MKPAPYLKWGLVLIVILGFSGTVFSRPSIAQSNERIPKVSLKILIVPEKVACQPGGYQSYDSDAKSSDCKPLTIADIPMLEKQAIVIQTESVPPSNIKLSDKFYDILEAYRTAGKSNPGKRRAIVMVFKWDTDISSLVSLKRVINTEYTDIPGFDWSGALFREQHWIHHERADAFLPGYKVEWTLKVGDHIWTFHTVRK